MLRIRIPCIQGCWIFSFSSIKAWHINISTHTVSSYLLIPSGSRCFCAVSLCCRWLPRLRIDTIVSQIKKQICRNISKVEALELVNDRLEFKPSPLVIPKPVILLPCSMNCEDCGHVFNFACVYYERKCWSIEKFQKRHTETQRKDL